MNEVSCKALTPHFEFLKENGVDLARHCEGLRYRLDNLKNPNNRIDWDTFVELCRRLRRHAISDDQVVSLGTRLPASKPFRVFGVIAGMLASPLRFYLWAGRGTRMLFTNIVPKFEVVDDRTLVIRLSFTPGCRPCPEYFLISCGALMVMPQLLGYPRAEVEMTQDGHSATYRVVVPASRTLWSRVGRFFGVLRSASGAVRELEANNELLIQRYNDLVEAHSKIREQSALIAAVHDFATLCAQTLDVDQLGRTAADVIARNTRRPVRLQLVGALPMAWHAAPPDAPPPTPDTPYASFPVDRGGKHLARLEFAGSAADLPPFAEAVIPTLAVSLDNALAYLDLQISGDRLELMVRDRTAELERTARNLQESLDTIQSLERARAEFFANVAHEIRTPMAMIAAPMEVILLGDRGILPERARVELEAALKTIRRVQRLTGDLLDHARLDAGRLALARYPTPLDVLVRDLITNVTPLAERANLRLSVSVRPEPFPIAHVDPDRAEQMVLNLLTNAIKFTPAGGSVDVSLVAEDGVAVVTVRDTGVGIPKEDQPRLFDRFAQADNQGVRKLGGSGLGLSLVKEMAELHGGSIAVDSQPTRGSTFVLRLPLGSPADTPPAGARARARLTRSDDLDLALRFGPVAAAGPGPEPSPPGAPTLLVVEDDDPLRAFLTRLLGPRYRLLLAKNGRDALQIARTQKPDLVLSDVVMPILSGLQLVRELRRDPATLDLPVILLTARREVEQLTEGFFLGANDYVGKPFHPRELVARIEAQLKLRDATRAAAVQSGLATLGLVSSGFAHEVRNPLSCILNAVEPLRRGIAQDDPRLTESMIGVFETCSVRIKDLAESLLRLIRPTGPRDPVDVVAGLEATLEVLGWKFGPKIRVVRAFGDRSEVEGDGAALNQVWANLIDNAVDAMPEGGTLTVATQRTDGRLVVRVADTGTGIPDEVRDRLFEPFFSTKPAGEGTGLGLALCHRVVLAHGGKIRIRSETGSGTEVEVTLPAGGDRSW